MCITYYFIFLKKDAGRVKWRYYNTSVHLTSPRIEQCQDVMTRLIRELHTGKEWSLRLWSSSPESSWVVLNDLNNCTVRELEILNTPLDSDCALTLSEVLKTNATLKTLLLRSSPFNDGIKPVSDAFYINATIEVLEVYNITLTDEDTLHLSNMLTVNKTLKVLRLSNITDNGVRHICEGLAQNHSLITLNIGDNHQINSVSTSTIAELIHTTTSLTELYLDNTSLNNDDIQIICTTLTSNTTIQILYLSKKHEEYCEKLDGYHFLKDRIAFV